MPLKGRLKPSSRITLCEAQAAGVVGRIAPGKPFGNGQLRTLRKSRNGTQSRQYAYA